MLFCLDYLVNFHLNASFIFPVDVPREGHLTLTLLNQELQSVTGTLRNGI
jgi:hypothetical protein